MSSISVIALWGMWDLYGELKRDPFGPKFLTAAWWILKCVTASGTG